MRPAVFLDRDGVVNVDKQYVGRPEDFEFVEGAAAALREIGGLGYPLVVVTNQSGIGRGYYSEDDYQRLNRWMLAVLESQAVQVAGTYHCPHRPEEGCPCRKPAPGLLLKAAAEHDLDLANSWMIGDSLRDIEAAQRAGLRRTILLSSSHTPKSDAAQALFVAPAISDTVRIISKR